MTWVREGTADAPAWGGVDHIFSMFHRELAQQWALRNIVLLIGIPVGYLGAFGGAFYFVVGLIHPRATWHEVWTLLLVSLASFGLLAVMALGARWSSPCPNHFLTRDWQLTLKGDALLYRVTHLKTARDPLRSEHVSYFDSWKVSLDAIARVESGLTRDWEPARNYPGQPPHKNLRLVPEHEYHTFLLLADGSRRVIYTVNAGRENCATLAHSIRSWLEARRAEPVLLSMGEGFEV